MTYTLLPNMCVIVLHIVQLNFNWHTITITEQDVGFWSILKLVFIPRSLLSFTMEKSWTPIDCHCKNFNSLILRSHTWNIVDPNWTLSKWISFLIVHFTSYYTWYIFPNFANLLLWYCHFEPISIFPFVAIIILPN